MNQLEQSSKVAADVRGSVVWFKTWKCARCNHRIRKKTSPCFEMRVLHEDEFALETQRLEHAQRSLHGHGELRPSAMCDVFQRSLKSVENEYVLCYCQKCSMHMHYYYDSLLSYILRRNDFCISESKNSSGVMNGPNDPIWQVSVAVELLARLMHPQIELIAPVGGNGGYDLLDDESNDKGYIGIRLKELLYKHGAGWHSRFPEACILLFNESCFSQLPLSFMRRSFFFTHLWVTRISFPNTGPKNSDLPADVLQPGDMSRRWTDTDICMRDAIVLLLKKELSALRCHNTLKVWVVDSPDKSPDFRYLDVVCLLRIHETTKTSDILFRSVHRWTPDFIETDSEANEHIGICATLDRRCVTDALTRCVGDKCSIFDVQERSPVSHSLNRLALSNHKTWGTALLSDDLAHAPTYPSATYSAWLLNCYAPGTKKGWGLVNYPSETEDGHAISMRPFFVQVDMHAKQPLPHLAIPKLFLADGDRNWQAFVQNAGVFSVRTMPRVHFFHEVARKQV